MLFHKHCIIGLLALSLAGCKNQPIQPASVAADAIYYGGDILTMEGDSATYVEAIAVKDGKIVFVGRKADAEKMKADSTVMHDLQGKTEVHPAIMRLLKDLSPCESRGFSIYMDI